MKTHCRCKLQQKAHSLPGDAIQKAHKTTCAKWLRTNTVSMLVNVDQKRLSKCLANMTTCKTEKKKKKVSKCMQTMACQDSSNYTLHGQNKSRHVTTICKQKTMLAVHQAVQVGGGKKNGHA